MSGDERPDTDSVACPRCSGARGSNAFCDGDAGSSYRWVPCLLCKGDGAVTRGQWRRHHEGRRRRAERIARGESIAAAAKRLGITPAELCNRERGE